MAPLRKPGCGIGHRTTGQGWVRGSTWDRRHSCKTTNHRARTKLWHKSQSQKQFLFSKKGPKPPPAAQGKARNMDRQVLTWTFSCYLRVLAGVPNLRTVNSMLLPQHLETQARHLAAGPEELKCPKISVYQPHNLYKHRARDMEARTHEVWIQTAFSSCYPSKGYGPQVGHIRD